MEPIRKEEDDCVEQPVAAPVERAMKQDEAAVEGNVSKDQALPSEPERAAGPEPTREVAEPRKNMPAETEAMAQKDEWRTSSEKASMKDELVLTLGWGTKKRDEVKDCKAAPDFSLSLGSSGAPSQSVYSVSNTRSFVHNPSCSLTRTSFDELNSSASQYLSVDQEQSVYHGGTFASHFKHKEHEQRPASSAGRATTTTTTTTAVSADAVPLRTWSSQNLEDRYHQAALPSSFSELEGFGSRRERSSSRGAASSQELGRFHVPGDRRISLYSVAAEPVPVVAHRLQELPDILLEDLKKSTTEMLGRTDKRGEFLMLQRIIEGRTDLTSESLFLAHRIQLEILVALKTGIQAFLLRENPLSTSSLVEIFLEKRCRNFACQNQLPADDCDCQFCQKDGFCNACMCIGCSKFDFMANTCRWVGCDFCLHWCHTDCGIRLAYIKPGPLQNKPGQSEMQFLCVACGHASDLFGFVKEVFTTYAKDWGADILRQELDCIHRIFRRSQDSRGKQLCWVSEQLLVKTEASTDTTRICEAMIQFLADGRLEFDKQGLAAACSKELDDVKAATDDSTVKSSRDREGVESLISIKQAEARMFRMKAEQAKCEAEALNKILVAKSVKLAEDYSVKVHKLQIDKSLDKRKRCLLEYQRLEHDLLQFNTMKSKLLSNVHDVLRRMDAFKRKRFLKLHLRRAGLESSLQTLSISPTGGDGSGDSPRDDSHYDDRDGGRDNLNKDASPNSPSSSEPSFSPGSANGSFKRLQAHLQTQFLLWSCYYLLLSSQHQSLVNIRQCVR